MSFLIALLLLTNGARVHPLKESAYLDTFAQSRAEYLCTHPFSHEQWYKIRSTITFAFVGENLAQGFNNDPKVIFNAWMNSPEHKINIVSTNFKYIGIANKCNITVEEFGG